MTNKNETLYWEVPMSREDWEAPCNKFLKEHPEFKIKEPMNLKTSITTSSIDNYTPVDCFWVELKKQE